MSDERLAAQAAELERLRKTPQPVEDAAERISQILYPELPGITDSDGVMFARESVRGNVKGIITALIVERDAVLRECRSALRDATRIHRHVYVDGRCKSCRLLARINAILGKEGDGA